MVPVASGCVDREGKVWAELTVLIDHLQVCRIRKQDWTASLIVRPRAYVCQLGLTSQRSSSLQKHSIAVDEVFEHRSLWDITHSSSQGSHGRDV